MCWECVEEAGGGTIDPAPYRGLIAWVAAWYADGHGTGGPLHVQLDDHNLDDDMLTIKPYMVEQGCYAHDPAECLREAYLLLQCLATLDEAERNVVAWYGTKLYYDLTETRRQEFVEVITP